MRKYLLLLGLCAAIGAGAAAAQVMRQLPAGERARVSEPQPLPLVKLDRRVMRLAPGGRIYDQENRTIVHAQLPANAEVLYTKDQNGDVQRIYILTPDEQARLSRRR